MKRALKLLIAGVLYMILSHFLEGADETMKDGDINRE